ncbi:50S ribosomal protein L29 [bacterium]|nr:50S ribosomal protein L29 [candidate division CSSED10-310 bacterium]
MKASQLREMSVQELELKRKELKEMIFRYRFQAAIGQLVNPLVLRQSKRDIARINTVLNNKAKASELTQG